jgi:WD40 repeat protein
LAHYVITGRLLNADALQWSPTGSYLASHCEDMANVVWIWEVSAKLQLVSVLHHLNAVRSVKWHSKQDQLAIAASSSKIYIWNDQGASCISIPGAPSFQASELAWPDALLVADKARFCCAYSSR